ncbi:ribonuclease HII [Candidatus Woesearchaeota archaeon]|nr:ribonuclease HII [Candidatus Woesearchaeota archaeon]MBW3017144.1 ribonuclease HII [Candidatus Woesearchaeota archaeon]
MIICGIDEAGKGPCIGPLVMCGLCVDEKDELKLKVLGVKDSKMLTPLRRQLLFDEIKKIAKSYKIVKVWPDEIDKAVNSMSSSLNQLESEKSAEIINELKPEKAILDCPSPNKKDYKFMVTKNLKVKAVLVPEHKADAKYPVVSAASILAKVERDREIEKLKQKYNVDFGSGYTSDEVTQSFIKENWENPEYKPMFRMSWESLKRLKMDKGQKKLGEF